MEIWHFDLRRAHKLTKKHEDANNVVVDHVILDRWRHHHSEHKVPLAVQSFSCEQGRDESGLLYTEWRVAIQVGKGSIPGAEFAAWWKANRPTFVAQAPK